MKVRVVGPFQVKHDGKRHTEGDVFDASENVARQWVALGYVAEVKDEKPPAAKTAPARRSSKSDD